MLCPSEHCTTACMHAHMCRYYQDEKQASKEAGEEEDAEPERAKHMDPDELLKQAEDDAHIDQVCWLGTAVHPSAKWHAKAVHPFAEWIAKCHWERLRFVTCSSFQLLAFLGVCGGM